jgi:molecular chaperone DnaK
MPAVQRAVKQFFGKDPHKGVNPDEVVAAGAALQGAALGDEKVEVLLLDVTPLSLGVETGGGVFTVLIPRNTTIPTEKAEIFTTSIDNQNFVPVHILQGERKMAADNRSLNRFELTGIPPAPRGLPKIQVSFRIDADGIVSVEAKDLGTGKAQSIKVKPTSGLSQDAVDKLVTDAERFKYADELRRELAELRNQAETLLYTTEAALEGYADLVDAKMLDDARGLSGSCGVCWRRRRSWRRSAIRTRSSRRSRSASSRRCTAAVQAEAARPRPPEREVHLGWRRTRIRRSTSSHTVRIASPRSRQDSASSCDSGVVPST